MGEARPAVEEDVRHYAGVLRQAIRAAGLSVSEVERRLGAGPKSLRRVFSGQVDLKFKHVVAVLRIIGMPHEEFFAIAARRRRQRAQPLPGTEFLATLDRIGLRRELAPAADEAGAPDSEEEFDRMVEEAVDRVLKRRGLEAEPLPEDGLEGEPPPEEPARDREQLVGEAAPERRAADRQDESAEPGGEGEGEELRQPKGPKERG
jgi:hypothetical protein